MTNVLLYMCTCLEWTRGPTWTEECSVSCNTKITGKEERKNVSYFPPDLFALCGDMEAVQLYFGIHLILQPSTLKQKKNTFCTVSIIHKSYLCHLLKTFCLPSRMQKKAVGRHMGVLARNGHNAGFSAEQPQETKRGQFKANPQRVPKSTYSSRPQ